MGLSLSWRGKQCCGGNFGSDSAERKAHSEKPDEIPSGRVDVGLDWNCLPASDRGYGAQ